MLDKEEQKRFRTLIGQRLKLLREEARLSKAEVAKRIGVAVNTISSWEEGNTVMRGDYICKFCELYNVPANYIMGLSDERHKLKTNH